MDKVQNCILKYICNMLQSNNKFNLIMVNKQFRGIIKLNIKDFNYMTNNKYKMIHHKLLSLTNINNLSNKETDMYYINCFACKKAYIDYNYSKCCECETILCYNCWAATSYIKT